MADGARNADARLVAPLLDGLSKELLSRSSPTTPSFETARAPRGSSAGYLDSSSPVEDMRKRLRDLRTLVCTKGQMWRRVLEREVIERRHLEEEALLDRRRGDLESTIDPTVPETLKGLDVPTESERTAHESTRPPPASRCETCTLGRGIDAPHVRLTPLGLDERHIIAVDFGVRRGPSRRWGESMTMCRHFWQSSTWAPDACER